MTYRVAKAVDGWYHRRVEAGDRWSPLIERRGRFLCDWYEGVLTKDLW